MEHIKTTMFHPFLLPESADPEGSIRYKCTVIHEKIFSLNQRTFFYNRIADHNVFIVEEHSPDYNGYETSEFEGIVLKEANGGYSWWKTGEKDENV